jgi:hypothetical protein
LVCTDACKGGLGGVLTQNGHVISYESKNLKEHERNYLTHDLEFSPKIHALNMWKHYVMRNQFELRTNHSGPNYLFGKTTLNAMKTRW